MMVFNSTVANLKSQDGISSKPTNINKTCIANSPETIKRGSRERPQWPSADLTARESVNYNGFQR